MNHRLAGLATLAICVLPSAAGAQEAEARFHGLAAGAILLGLAVLLQAQVLRRALNDWAPSSYAAVVALSLILNLVSGSVLAMSAPILNVGPEYVLGEATPQDEINSRSYEIAVLKATEKRRPEVRETIGLLERRLEALKAASHPIRRWERMAQPGRWSPVALWAQMWAASIGLGVAKQWPMIIVFSLKVIRRPNTLVCLKAAILSVLVVHAMYLLVYLAAPGTPYSALHR